MSEAGAFPKIGLIYLGAWGLFSAGTDIFAWLHRPSFEPADYFLAAVNLIALAAITYSYAAWMAGAQRTLRGAVGFFGTGVAVFLPTLMAFGLLLVAARAKILWAEILLVLTVFVSLLPISILVGWPIWQATSDRLIGPLEALNATKGIRWPLFFAAGIISSLNRGFPSASKVADLRMACALAIGNGVVGCVTTVLGLSIAVAAYRRMLANSQAARG
jgi:hypothetical protein